MNKLIYFFLLWAIPAFLYGQEDSVLDSVITNMTKQLVIFPQEKIYLHTDKPYYITGEKIFFRAFLLNAFSNKPDTISRYVYVELINPADSVVQRIKIRKDSTDRFYGVIPLQEDLPQATYKIRAYTQYMYNQGESSFFSKSVPISDPQILSEQIESNFQFTKNGKINANLRFINAKTQEVIHHKSVTLRLNQEQPFTKKPDDEGWVHVNLTIPVQATKRVLYVELPEHRRAFKQYLQIPYPEGDFDVSFYPEGGHLITGKPSNVAFKAVDTNGTALDITGEIIDSKGGMITAFKTFHDGMGNFLVIPQQGEHYQAVCHSGDRTLRFDLPEAQMNTFALRSYIRDHKLLISINKYDSNPYPELYLLVHSGGLVIYAQGWNPSKEYISFDTSVFPSGISHIVLFTKDLQIVSERLVFLLNDDNGLATFQTQKDAYRKREQIQAGIQLKDEKQQPLKGSFSIAVTNDKEVVADTASGIFSDILLLSELRGHIENPEYYFQKGNKEAELAADLLMKTHGWTRYAIPDVIRGKLTYPEIPFETSQKISGTVKSGLFSKPAKNFNVTLLSLNAGFYDFAETNENGRYVFQNFEFPDSTKFVIQALNNKGKGKQMTELLVNEDTFPEIHVIWNYPIVQKETTNSTFLDYIAKADLQYTYQNGMRMVNLPEVEVKANYIDKNEYKSPYGINPDYSFSENEIKNVSEVKTLFYRVAGVMVSGNSIRIRGASGPPLIVIDDVPFMTNNEDQATMDIFDMLDINDIGQIDILKDISNTALYGSRGANGVIVIYTKKGDGISTSMSFNIKQLIPLGYQLPVEFYSPKYDTQESIENSKPDLRTTIYWNPNAITDDEGNVKLNFYSADDPATYSVIIEGVSNDGKLIHYRGSSSIIVK
ncbi:MAG: TonB-dependent receptor plug domain-containing protein [Candidatus Azobacteroides sp.]|nr:TonB-dependent receptor plug domain-containing protein [Candidatus Azobacteroides sp.]